MAIYEFKEQPIAQLRQYCEARAKGKKPAGTFKQVARAARTGFNPQAGTKIKIAASKVPKFTPGTAFKAAVDAKFAKRKADKAAAAPKNAVKKPVGKKATKPALHKAA
ncbi:HU family DNA-binding protein [Ramlibacter sp.]|uniref:HU family DNA-binding protein n=1 Tax=Ramlibacter sp. TaxID=1917967 RepID=UPI0026269D6A|nr:HU family DNA-binding protein [Ramlibacter sp.]MDB5954099.1 histone family protein DNA-binding protein [Ramlibacter sp.]